MKQRHKFVLWRLLKGILRNEWKSKDCISFHLTFYSHMVCGLLEDENSPIFHTLPIIPQILVALGLSGELISEGSKTWIRLQDSPRECIEELVVAAG